MKTVLEEIVLVVFVIAVYVALPAGIIAGWIGWVRSKAPETRFSLLSLLAFGLATCSGLLALISLIYAHAIGGFPFITTHGSYGFIDGAASLPMWGWFWRSSYR